MNKRREKKNGVWWQAVFVAEQQSSRHRRGRFRRPLRTVKNNLSEQRSRYSSNCKPAFLEANFRRGTAFALGVGVETNAGLPRVAAGRAGELTHHDVSNDRRDDHKPKLSIAIEPGTIAQTKNVPAIGVPLYGDVNTLRVTRARTTPGTFTMPACRWFDRPRRAPFSRSAQFLNTFPSPSP